MDNILKKVFYIISIILIVIATSYQVAVLFQGGDDVSDSVLDGYFLVAYIALGLSLIIAILFPIIQMASNPKGAIRTFIGIGLVVALWFIASAFSGNEFSPATLEKMKTTAETSIMVGTGLIYTYVIFGLAILSIIYASVSNLFK